MPTRLAILGLDAIQRDWLTAVRALVDSGEVEVVAVGHRTQALARDVADTFESPAPPAFDDLRQFMQAAPQVVLMDRPEHASIDFLTACFDANIAIFSLGPPVRAYHEAHALADALEPRTHLLYCWPRFADAFAYKHTAQADEYVRPIKFASLHWAAFNHALAKANDSAAGNGEIVRSMSVLAWDALATLIDLIGVPLSVYASIRGTTATGEAFTDITGAASLTLLFADEATASVTLCDRAPSRREVLLMGQNGSLELREHAYLYRDAGGGLVDCGEVRALPAAATYAALLRTFIEHYHMPPSPHRGWPHRLEETASALEAMLVSHRTGQAESPERFRLLRR